MIPGLKIEHEQPICIGCTREFDPETVDPDSQYCFGCSVGDPNEIPAGAVKKFSQSEIRPGYSKKSAAQRHKKKSKRRTSPYQLPVGIMKYQRGKYWYYEAFFGPFNLRIGIKTHGEEEALELAKYVRKRMVQLKTPDKIEEFLEEYKSDSRKKDVHKALPVGVGYCNETKKEKASYAATMSLDGVTLRQKFSISKFGKRQALELAWYTRKRMERLNSVPLIRKFIQEEIKPLKNLKKFKLPEGVSYLVTEEEAPFFGAYYRYNGNVRRIQFSEQTYGLMLAMGLAIHTRKRVEAMDEEEIDVFTRVELPQLRELKYVPMFEVGDVALDYWIEEDRFKGTVLGLPERVMIEADTIQQLSDEFRVLVSEDTE